MSTTGAGTAVSVASLSQWTLNMSTDKADVTAFGDTNKVSVQGLPARTGTLAGWWDSATDAMFDASDSADGVKMYLYPSANAPSIYFYGPAWVDSSIDVPVSGPISLSGAFEANGGWGRMP